MTLQLLKKRYLGGAVVLVLRVDELEVDGHGRVLVVLVILPRWVHILTSSSSVW